MKSQTYASPATDEEIIELTDVVKSGPEAEEVIIDLTDPIETVKAEPLDPSPGTDDVSIEAAFADEVSKEAFTDEEASSIDAADLMDLDEIVIDDVEELVDLTEPLDPPGDTVTLDASEEFSGEGEEMLDLEDVFAADSAADALDVDLADASDPPESETKMLDLDEALIDDGATLDQSRTTDAPVEIEADYDVLDLAEALDSAEADIDLSEDPIVDEAIEVIETDPVELTDEFVDDAQAAATDSIEPVLDLDQPIETAMSEASKRSDGLPTDADDGDDLVFELDEMLAEAQADMPAMAEDETEMELDLSEALADAAAEAGVGNNGASAEETILDLEDPLESTPPAPEEDLEDLDLISADNIIDLEELASSEEAADVDATALHEEKSALDNVINLADVTGGYPTVPPAAEADHGTAADAGADEDELASEMEKLEATLDDVFEDDADDAMSDDLLGDDLPDEIVLAEEAPDEVSLEAVAFNQEAVETDAASEDVTDTAAAVAASAGAFSTAETGADNIVPTPDGGADDSTPAPALAPTDIPEEALNAAVERVIKTMYADRIEQMILDVIKEAVTAEIDKVKRSLGETGPDTD